MNPGHVRRCENCGIRYTVRPDTVLKSFCTRCRVFFSRPPDTPREQAAARQARPSRIIPLTAESIIDQWAKEA